MGGSPTPIFFQGSVSRDSAAPTRHARGSAMVPVVPGPLATLAAQQALRTASNCPEMDRTGGNMMETCSLGSDFMGIDGDSMGFEWDDMNS